MTAPLGMQETTCLDHLLQPSAAAAVVLLLLQQQ
jgi:hypothetical protein